MLYLTSLRSAAHSVKQIALKHVAFKHMGGALGLSLFALGGMPSIAAPRPFNVTHSTPSQSSQLLVAQLLKRPPTAGSNAPAANGCGTAGCRLTIDQTLLQPGDKVMANYTGKDQQIIQTGETRKIVLTLSQPVVNRGGQIMVPAGSAIEGQVVPVEGGGQFVAQRLVVNGTAYAFAAESGTLHDVKDPTQTSIGAIAGDAAIGAAGGIVLGQILGDRGITATQVLGGAAAGAAIGNVTAPRAVVIDPGNEIELRVTNGFKLL